MVLPSVVTNEYCWISRSSKDLALDMVYGSSFTAIRLKLFSIHIPHNEPYFCRAETNDYHNPHKKIVLNQVSIPVNGVPSNKPVEIVLVVILIVKIHFSWFNDQIFNGENYVNTNKWQF